MAIDNRIIPMSEEHFRTIHSFHVPDKPNLRTRLKTLIRDTNLSPLQFFPILTWIRTYKVKEDLVGDLIAGATCSVLQIPHALAFAPLAGQDPVIGLYMAVFPPLIYVLMGSSRHLSLGIFAILMMMVGKVVSDNADSGYSNLEIAIAITFLAGIWQCMFGALRLGFLCVLLSENLVSGFMCAASAHIMLLQFKYMMGVTVDKFNGPFKIIFNVIEYAGRVPETNLISLAISIISVIILYCYNEYAKPKLARKTKIPIPFDFLLICIATLISYFLDLNGNYNVSIVGHIPQGLPDFKIPPFTAMPSLIIDAMIIAIVNITVNVSLATVFARKANYKLDNNQEMIAIGFANIFGSFVQSVPACGSISRTAVVYNVGGKTQITTAFSSVVGLLILLFAAQLLGFIPMCVLAAIVFVTLKNVFLQVKEVPSIWRRGKTEAIIWLSTYFGVLFLDIALGILMGLIVSLILVILRGVSMDIIVLGKIPNEDVFVDNKYYDAQSQVLILKLTGCINFINCHAIASKVRKEFQSYCALEKQVYSRYIVLDFGSISYVDTAGVEELIIIYDEVKSINCDVIITNCSTNVYTCLQANGFFTKFPKEHVIVSIDEAVSYLKRLGLL